jgi:hypothetical protein
MNIDLSFINTPIKRKIKKPIKNIIKISNEHTPIEIQNMTMPQLEYLYEHGSPTEKEIVGNIMFTRKKFDMATIVPDDILPSGSPGGR